MAGKVRALLILGMIAFAFSVSRCGGCSVYPSCVLSTAIRVNVTSAAGEPIAGASAQVSDAPLAIKCNSGSLANMCIVFGGPGTYNVRVTAAGFQPVTESITVTGTSPRCGCGTPNTRTVTIVLTPS